MRIRPMAGDTKAQGLSCPAANVGQNCEMEVGFLEEMYFFVSVWLRRAASILPRSLSYTCFITLEKCFNPSATVRNALIFSVKVAEGFDFTTLQICTTLGSADFTRTTA